MAIVEYVASGTNYMFISHADLYTQEFGTNRAYEFFRSALAHVNRDHHKLSMLFNAYQEQKFGPIMKEHYSDVIHDVHADSGGLQMITLNKKVTPEIKQEVYKLQGECADIGMSFDEIPVKIAVNDDEEGQTQGKERVFDVEGYEAKAILSGQNLNEQIEAFKRNESDCKPYAIMHGNCLKTYQRWCELVIEQVPEENREYIGGAAMGFGGMGFGELEGIKAAFYAHFLPYKFKGIHFLGVGSISRLYSVVVMRNLGWFDDVNLSYDSTSHTSGPNWGNYYTDYSKGSISCKRHDKKSIQKVYDDIKAKLPMFDLTIDEYREGISRYGMTEYGDDIQMRWKRIIAWQAHILASVLNFTVLFDNISNDFNKAIALMSPKTAIAYKALMQVKDEESFEQWVKAFKGVIPSEPVRTSQTATDGAGIASFAVGGKRAKGHVPTKKKSKSVDGDFSFNKFT